MATMNKETLVEFLWDIYSIESQSIALMESAPEMISDQKIIQYFANHLVESRLHADRIKDKLTDYGVERPEEKKPSNQLSNENFLIFEGFFKDRFSRIIAHAYAYQALEWAGYLILERLSSELKDVDTYKMARENRHEEQNMMAALEARFDESEDIAHLGASPNKLYQHMGMHLSEIIGLNKLNILALQSAIQSTKEWTRLRELYQVHLGYSEKIMKQQESRQSVYGAQWPSQRVNLTHLKSTRGRIQFGSNVDPNINQALFIYAFKHLMQAAYELLMSLALRIGDDVTAKHCKVSLREDRFFCYRLSQHLPELLTRA